MKKIIFALCAAVFFLSIAAQVPNARMTKPDTSKKNTRIANTNTGIATNPGIKTAARGTKLNNNQIVVLGIDPTKTLFTENPKLISLILEIGKNETPVNQAFTPSNACPNQDNCVFYNTTVTDIQKGGFSQWTFKRNAEIKSTQIIKVMPKLQPNKDYMVVIDVNVASRSPGVELTVNGYRFKGPKSTDYDGHDFPMVLGKNQFVFILYTGSDYKFAGLGPECSYLALLPTGDQKDSEFYFHIYSIKVKEVNMN